MKIPNTTEIAVIFERTGADDEVTMFYPKKVVIGYADKKKKVFTKCKDFTNLLNKFLVRE